MVYENIKLKPHETLSQVAGYYGYNSWEWRKIWDDPKNAALKLKRGQATKLITGDELYLPIPWTITSKLMAGTGNLFSIDVKRNGNKGKNLKWVQTVFEDNQPINPAYTYGGAFTNFCVDAPDDDEPFYYTAAEMATRPGYRTAFHDRPGRHAPLSRATAWRAVLSIGITSGKRVSVYDSIVWGVDFGTNGTNRMYHPRKATEYEIKGHLNLLKSGKGISGNTFTSLGWTFREALKS
ncbi:hypothetical protein ACTHGU_08960 [Chitinophagaceae bacterium MMS25-I14]